MKRLAKRLADLHEPHEAALLRRAVDGAAKLPLGTGGVAGEQFLLAAFGLAVRPTMGTL